MSGLFVVLLCKGCRTIHQVRVQEFPRGGLKMLIFNFLLFIIYVWEGGRVGCCEMIQK